MLLLTLALNILYQTSCLQFISQNSFDTSMVLVCFYLTALVSVSFDVVPVYKIKLSLVLQSQCCLWNLSSPRAPLAMLFFSMVTVTLNLVPVLFFTIKQHSWTQ